MFDAGTKATTIIPETVEEETADSFDIGISDTDKLALVERNRVCKFSKYGTHL